MSEFGSIKHEVARIGSLQKALNQLTENLKYYSEMNDLLLALFSGEVSMTATTVKVKIDPPRTKFYDLSIPDKHKQKILEVFGEIIKEAMLNMHTEIMEASRKISNDDTPTDI